MYICIYYNTTSTFYNQIRNIIIICIIHLGEFLLFKLKMEGKRSMGKEVDIVEEKAVCINYIYTKLILLIELILSEIKSSSS